MQRPQGAQRFTLAITTLVLALAGCAEALEPTPTPTSLAPPPDTFATPAAPATPEAPGQQVQPDQTPQPDEPPEAEPTPEIEEPATTPMPEAAQDPFFVVAELVALVEPSVVAIITDEGLGSGVIYSTDGAIVTNHHVVVEANDVGVALATGERLLAEVVGSDPGTDVAVLRIERNDLPAVEWAPDLPRLGSLAVAIGSPLGLHNSVTAGVVSGVQRSIPGAAARAPALIDLIQTDAAISPGNSGGPIVGADGRVMGLAVAHIPPELRAVSIGFAIPAATVVDVVETILAGDEVRHAWLGVQTTPVTPELAERFDLQVALGAVVLDTVPGSPADDAGIQTGDVIVGLAGETVDRVEDLLSVLRRLNPGDTVEVEVERNGELLALSVTLAERP